MQKNQPKQIHVMRIIRFAFASLTIINSVAIAEAFASAPTIVKNPRYNYNRQRLNKVPNVQQEFSEDSGLIKSAVTASTHTKSLKSSQAVSYGKTDEKSILGFVAFGLYATVSSFVALKSVQNGTWLNAQEMQSFVQDIIASIVCAIAGSTWVKIWTRLQSKDILSSKLTRKI